MSNVYMAQYVLLILGMAFAGYWAYEAFDTRPIKLGDGPALPRYMTQPGQYRNFQRGDICQPAEGRERLESDLCAPPRRARLDIHPADRQRTHGHDAR